ncbi:MFS transporter [Corynebacterium uropygiale]|uniref:MFS transporter n=1 Tax=Corynebacterium uropygiale TaxID=1775911 RepID=A0A9X1QS41_9CORY|nr:MFS transporter [Corynebacterium uropygiale]MCF4006000.1 MFS transporter [Corynebacterium uropygiale]
MQRRPIPVQTVISRRRRILVMLALAVGGFGIGTTEFVSMGLLNLIAQDYQITEETAGRIISAYALGVVVGAPVIAAFTGKLPRRRLLLLFMAAFTVGNALTILASNYELLLVSRFIAGFPHGAYFSVAGLSAASMAPKRERGRALAFVGMGLSVSLVIGVPIAQGIGQIAGWQAAYGLVTLIGLVTIAALWFLMPHMTEMAATDPRTELGALAKPQVWLTVIMGTVGFGGMFAVYTYISWTMTERAGLDPCLMPLVLTIYGVGSVVGNWLGGRVADRNLEGGILFSFIMIAVVLLSFYTLSTMPILGTINFGLVGMFGSCLIPSLQIRLMEVAGRAQTLAASLNQSALNLANASGAAIGGAVISAGYSYSAPALAGASLALIAILVWVGAYRLRRVQAAR